MELPHEIFGKIENTEPDKVSQTSRDNSIGMVMFTVMTDVTGRDRGNQDRGLLDMCYKAFHCKAKVKVQCNGCAQDTQDMIYDVVHNIFPIYLAYMWYILDMCYKAFHCNEKVKARSLYTRYTGYNHTGWSKS